MIMMEQKKKIPLNFNEILQFDFSSCDFKVTKVIRIGFKPMACCLEGSCSIQLSYRTIFPLIQLSYQTS